jgi:hypothetical protein
MKIRDQAAMSDGFDRNVAQKMPKIRRQEEFAPPVQEPEPPWSSEEPLEELTPEKEPEKRVSSHLQSLGLKRRSLWTHGFDRGSPLSTSRSNQTKRALETDLSASHKTVQQLIAAGKRSDAGIPWRPLDELCQPFTEVGIVFYNGNCYLIVFHECPPRLQGNQSLFCSQ